MLPEIAAIIVSGGFVSYKLLSQIPPYAGLYKTILLGATAYGVTYGIMEIIDRRRKFRLHAIDHYKKLFPERIEQPTRMRLFRKIDTCTDLVLVTDLNSVSDLMTTKFNDFLHEAHIIESLDANKLVDPQFIAGFCRIGDVTIFPLRLSPDLNIYIKKSVLTLEMSSRVYTGFGIAAKKIKWDKKRHFYRFSLSLGKTQFQCESPMHKRLRSFFAALTDPFELGTRLPQDLSTNRQCSYFVQWQPYSKEFEQTVECASTALGNFLNKAKHVVIRLQLDQYDLEGIDVPIPHLSSTSISNCSSTDFQVALTQLAYLANGLLYPLRADGIVKENPCLTNSRLTPIYHDTISQLNGSSYSIKNAKVIHLTGLFSSDQLDLFSHKIKACLTESRHSGLAYWVQTPLSWNLSQDGTVCAPNSSLGTLYFIDNNHGQSTMTEFPF